MSLRAAPEARGTQGSFPTLNQGAVPGERPEEVRFADVAVVQPIPRTGLKGILVEHPSVKRNGHAELVFSIALSPQRAEGQTLAVGQIDQWTGSGQEGALDRIRPKSPERSSSAAGF